MPADADEESGFLMTVDGFDVQSVAETINGMQLTPKTQKLLKAFASAPNRCMTRLQLARAIGSENENACNSVLGTFASKLIAALDEDVAEQWRPHGYFVNFVVDGVERPDLKIRPDPDTSAFVMRDALARALDVVGIAPFVELSDDLKLSMYGDDDEEDWDPLDTTDDPLGDIVAAEEELADLSVTEREAVISARVGQGQFREDVLEAWDGGCAVTGVSVSAALTASHIKPWRVSTNEERLNPSNGLPLVGTLDRLFDAGLITFLDDGRVVISSFVPESQFMALGLAHDLRLREARKELTPYLKYHRNVRFRRESSDDDE